MEFRGGGTACVCVCVIITTLQEINLGYKKPEQLSFEVNIHNQAFEVHKDEILGNRNNRDLVSLRATASLRANDGTYSHKSIIIESFSYSPPSRFFLVCTV
jgi:hypothetical protein